MAFYAPAWQKLKMVLYYGPKRWAVKFYITDFPHINPILYEIAFSELRNLWEKIIILLSEGGCEAPSHPMTIRNVTPWQGTSRAI